MRITIFYPCVYIARLTVLFMCLHFYHNTQRSRKKAVPTASILLLADCMVKLMVSELVINVYAHNFSLACVDVRVCCYYIVIPILGGICRISPGWIGLGSYIRYYRTKICKQITIFYNVFYIFFPADTFDSKYCDTGFWSFKCH